MADPISPQSTGRPADAWQAVEALVHEVAREAETATDSDAFYQLLVQRGVQAAGGIGGVLWMDQGQQQWESVGEFRFWVSVDREQAAAFHRQLLEQIAARPEPLAVGPGDSLASAENTSAWWILACPVLIDGRLRAVLQILMRPASSGSFIAAALETLAALADVVVSHHRCRTIRRLRDRLAENETWQAFRAQLQQQWELPETAYRLANDGRLLVGCDRISLMVRRSRRFRVLAISGVDQVEVRAKTTFQLRQLAASVAAYAEPVWWPDDDRCELPPPLERSLELYQDNAHTALVGAVPLRNIRAHEGSDDRPLGVLIIECFSAPDEEQQQRIRAAAEQLAIESQVAVAQAVRLAQLPFIRCSLWLEKWVRPWTASRTAQWVALVAGCVALLAILLLVRVPLAIEASGALQPVQKYHIYAPDDAIVSQLFVEHGQNVTAGQRLAQLKKPELDFQISQLVGEHESLEKELSRVRAARLMTDRSNGADQQQSQQLATDEQRLARQIANLERQQQILELARNELLLVSPVDGKVVTWDLDQNLRDRPLARGQRMLTVADVSGPWQLEVAMPEIEAGYLYDAQQRLGPDLPVRFSLATDPTSRRQATLQTVSVVATSSGDSPRSVVQLTALVDSTQPIGFRPGVTVVSRIECGQRPLGFVIIRKLYDFVRVQWL